MEAHGGLEGRRMETASNAEQLWVDTTLQHGMTDTWSSFAGHTIGMDTSLLSGEEITDYESSAEGNTDGKERKVSPGTAGSHISPRKPTRSMLAVSSMIGLIAAVILIRSLVRLLPPRKIAEKPTPPRALPLILKSSDLMNYKNLLINASKELEETWQRSPETVRRAFTKYFLPEVEIKGKDLQQGPLSLLQHPVESICGIQQPSEAADEQQKREYALQLLLVRTVITAATHRLNSLADLEEFCKEREIGSELLGLPMPTLPPFEDLAIQMEDLISFPEFLRMVDREVDQSSRRPADKQVPSKLAQILADLVLAGDIRAKADREVRNIFHDFLNLVSRLPLSVDQTGYHSGLEIPPIPGEDLPFSTSIFSAYVYGFDENSMTGCISTKSLELLSSRWTVEGAIGQLKALQKIEQLWLRQVHRAKQYHRSNWNKIIKEVKESRLPASEEDGQMETEGLLSLALYLL